MLMLPSSLWRSMGVDTEQLRAILNVRLMLDDRRPLTIGRQRQARKNKSGILMGMFFSVIMGFFYMLPIVVFSDRIFSITISFSLLFALLSLTLISDFSNVLFDTRDQFIILPRPVDDRTIVLSRTLHIFVYLFRVILPMAIPSWIALGVIDGWKSAVLFPFVLLLMVFMILFFVNGCYLLIIRLAKPEKFKEILNYFQILSSVAFFATAYLLPKTFRDDTMFHVTAASYPWLRYMPTYWLASCWSWIGAPAALSNTKWLGLLAIVFPIVCMYVLVKWLSPSFGRYIGAIDADTTTNTKKVKRSGSGIFYKALANILNKTDEAKAGFSFTWLQTARSRSFKMRVYPSFAFVPIYFVYIITSNKQSISEAIHSLGTKPNYLLLLYICSFVMIQALNYMNISEQYKAAWIYYATPVETPGRIMIGAFKAIWIKYLLPFFVVMAAFIVSVWGVHTIMDVILAFVNVTLFAACMVRVTYRHLPFSMLEQMKQRGNRFIKSFISMAIPGALGFGHYLALNMLWLKILFLVLSAILLWLVADSYANTSWADVRRAEAD